MSGFGELMREKRKERGMTEKELGDAIGVSRPFITMIEQGKATVPRNNVLLDKVIELLSLDIDDTYASAGRFPADMHRDCRTVIMVYRWFQKEENRIGFDIPFNTRGMTDE